MWLCDSIIGAICSCIEEGQEALLFWSGEWRVESGERFASQLMEMDQGKKEGGEKGAYILIPQSISHTGIRLTLFFSHEFYHDNLFSCILVNTVYLMAYTYYYRSEEVVAGVSADFGAQMMTNERWDK